MNIDIQSATGRAFVLSTVHIFGNSKLNIVSGVRIIDETTLSINDNSEINAFSRLDSALAYGDITINDNSKM